jgi:hypothetical protein
MSEEIKAETAPSVETGAPLVSAPESTPVKAAKIITPEKVPTSGQSAPPRKLEWDQLNAKERKVVEFLDGSGAGGRTIVTISTLAAECFFGEADTQAQAYSWARNCLRRLTTGSWVERFVRGSYRIHHKGRLRLKSVSES